MTRAPAPFLGLLLLLGLSSSACTDATPAVDMDCARCDETGSTMPAPLPATHPAAIDQPSDWVEFFDSPRVRQRYKIVSTGFPSKPLIFTETAAVVRAPADQIIRALRGDWRRWWINGDYELIRADDQVIEYFLWPAGRFGGFGVRARETMHQPEIQEDGSTFVRIDLDDCCVGEAYYHLVPMNDGWTSVYAVFNGVTEHTLGFTATQFAKNHLRAESGTLNEQLVVGSVFPEGTGLPGLVECLEETAGDCLAPIDAPPGS